jgi:mycothiol synthase
VADEVAPVSTASLDAAGRAAALELADRIEAEDGAPPLSDQARSRIGAAGGTDLAVYHAGRLVGYGRLDDGEAEFAAQQAVLPALLDTALQAADGELRVWSHGARSRVADALQAAGFEQIRELFQLRRPLDAGSLPPQDELPPDVRVRAFEPGRDEQAWLALNAAAFATHPEQGRWTSADLQARMAEPWFDPAGFLLAERAEKLLAFHWTKIHPGDIGEVYVLGVAPDAQGLGLGRALLIRGLRYLADRGCTTVLLYVDGDNTAALRLYERSGFTRHDVDRQWQRGAA